jgi:hypothetical protein
MRQILPDEIKILLLTIESITIYESNYKVMFDPRKHNNFTIRLRYECYPNLFKSCFVFLKIFLTSLEV